MGSHVTCLPQRMYEPPRDQIVAKLACLLGERDRIARVARSVAMQDRRSTARWSHFVLPERRARSYPRAVKIKMSNYARKRPTRSPPRRRRK